MLHGDPCPLLWPCLQTLGSVTFSLGSMYHIEIHGIALGSVTRMPHHYFLHLSAYRACMSHLQEYSHTWAVKGGYKVIVAHFSEQPTLGAIIF
jgi:hypothetical protein